MASFLQSRELQIFIAPRNVQLLGCDHTCLQDQERLTGSKQQRPPSYRQYHTAAGSSWPRLVRLIRGMVKTGYARQLQAVAVASRPPPTRAQHEARLVRLARFVARGVSPATCYSRDKRPWRGNFDPLGKDPGLSTDTPTISSIDKFVRTAQLPRQLSLQLRVMVLETKIYTSARKAYEVTLNRKYVGVQKLHFREWVSRSGALDLELGS